MVAKDNGAPGVSMQRKPRRPSATRESGWSAFDWNFTRPPIWARCGTAARLTWNGLCQIELRRVSRLIRSAGSSQDQLGQAVGRCSLHVQQVNVQVGTTKVTKRTKMGRAISQMRCPTVFRGGEETREPERRETLTLQSISWSTPDYLER